jgi:hypothetical protein
MMNLESLTEREQMQLAVFVHARRPHDSPLNHVQLRELFGKPKPKVSPCNVKGIHKLFLQRHHMCGGMHKLYQW